MDILNFSWDKWIPAEYAVLCFIIDTKQIMLIHKKTGLGAGKINAPGGRIEAGETAEHAVIRETYEETCITIKSPQKYADLSFVFTNGYSLQCSVFLTHNYSGKITETREALPFWCNIKEIPYDKMWEDDIYWLPQVLASKYVNAKFIFDEDKMLTKEITISNA